MPTDKKTNGRVGLLDELRGFAIICMVVYHALFDLNYFFGVKVPVFFDDWFDIVQTSFAGLFIFISGTVCRYSHNNLKRGVQCFFLGMILTFVTPFFTNGNIYFGILHFLGIAMMIFGLSEKVLDHIPALVGIIVFGVLFALSCYVVRVYNDSGEIVSGGFFGLPGLFEWKLPDELYNVGVLFPFGFDPKGFSSYDYFPIFPWLFLFIAGSYFGIWAKNGSLPKFFYPVHIKWLATVGRYTIWIYMLHQPVVYLIFSLIFR